MPAANHPPPTRERDESAGASHEEPASANQELQAKVAKPVLAAREQVEHELRVSEERLRLALESTQTGTWDWNMATGQVLWSPEHNAIFDFPAEQREGHFHQWRTRLHPDDLPRMADNFQAAVRERRDYRDEYRVIHRDSSVHWVVSSGRALYGPDGEHVRMIGVVRDITARKVAEAEAAATNERLGLAMEATHSGAWDEDKRTGEILWSPEHNEILGLPREQRVGSVGRWLACVHPDDCEAVVRTADEAIAQRRDWTQEFRAVHPDGSVRWVQNSARAFYDAAGEPVRVVGVVRDVTARKQAEEALRESEQRFRLANLHAPYPVMLYTDAGEIIQVNDAWTRLTGYRPEELTTMEDWLVRAYPDPTIQAEVRARVAALREGPGTSHSRGWLVRCADGRERVWDMSSAALGARRDGQTLRITTAVDVTERHEAEVALRAAKEEAERANRAKSEFLSRMSHELRTPLNAILGFGQVLEMSSLNGQDAACVGHILKGGQLLLSLVDEVLDLARVEAGELALQLQPLAFGALMRESAGFVAKLAAASGVTCTVKSTPAARTRVLADERRLRQVLLNLLSNAIKYNHPGGTVTLRCVAQPEGQVRLLVTDTGPGIAPEGLSRLFVPFERLGQELGAVEGTGLGLVVSRQLVEAMGGSLGAQSRLGHGSTFWVELPTRAEVSTLTNPPPGAPVVSPVEPEGPGPVTLLCIEDNPSNQQVLRTVVARLRPQWRYLSAVDGATGLEQARQQCPSLILLDLQLPGMKGDTVLGELRVSPETSKIPVVMLSADATIYSRERLMALGADDYLPKPFNVNELLEKIEAMTGSRCL